jgi:hypothetical protein
VPLADSPGPYSVGKRTAPNPFRCLFERQQPGRRELLHAARLVLLAHRQNTNFRVETPVGFLGAVAEREAQNAATASLLPHIHARFQLVNVKCRGSPIAEPQKEN